MGSSFKASKIDGKTFEGGGWVGRSPYGQNQNERSAPKCSRKFNNSEICSACVALNAGSDTRHVLLFGFGFWVSSFLCWGLVFARGGKGGGEGGGGRGGGKEGGGEGGGGRGGGRGGGEGGG